ncbi:MAG TPA: PEP-CTERM sorting domain-containing protein [Phycisphaerales bacterium]|nr:PEP-CTERM sorting domain-containing protein [Phycisphaerales bacterium]
MKTARIAAIVGASLGLAAGASAQNLSEGFDNIGALPGQGWAFRNNSDSPANGYFQGNTSVFAAHSGPANSYLGANFESTGAPVGTISNWAMTPARTYQNGDAISFYTRTVSQPFFPDRLEVRLSTNGASTDVGMTSTSVGDFTTLLLTINPVLSLAGYPTDWMQFQINISGLGGPVVGRLAFRYFVTFAGFAGTNSDYIGIDSLDIRGQSQIIPLPTAGAMGLAGFGFIATRRRRAG